MPACTRLRQVAHLDRAQGAARGDACGAASTTGCRPTSTCSRSTRVPHRFHARHAAVARSYLYQICAPPQRVCQAVRVVGEGAARSAAAMHAAAARFTGMHDFQAFSDDDPEEKSTDVLVEDVTLGEDGDLDPGPRRRLALHLEDGAAHGRRAGRGRHRPDRGERHPWPADRALGHSGAGHGAGIRIVPGARLLRRGRPATAARPRLPRRNATLGYFWFARASMSASARSRARPRRSFRLSKTNSWPALRASITGISAWRHCSSNFARSRLVLDARDQGLRGW